MDNKNFLIEHEDYTIKFKEFNLLVKNHVFSPDKNYTNSSSMIMNNFPNVKGKSILDVGVGTGILSLLASKRGAKIVTAIDISNEALLNASLNFEANNCDVNLIKSNLFENVKGKFDYIFANLPIDDSLWETVESTSSVIEKFLSQVSNYLNQNGEIYLTWFSISDVSKIQDLILSLNFKFDLISEKKLGFEWYLFKIKTN